MFKKYKYLKFYSSYGTILLQLKRCHFSWPNRYHKTPVYTQTDTNQTLMWQLNSNCVQTIQHAFNTNLHTQFKCCRDGLT